jgi:hypothetical protein
VAKLPVITVTHFKRLRYLNFARFSQFIFFEVHCIRLATIPLSDKIRRLRVVNSNTVKKSHKQIKHKNYSHTFPTDQFKMIDRCSAHSYSTICPRHRCPFLPTMVDATREFFRARSIEVARLLFEMESDNLSLISAMEDSSLICV